MATTATPAVKHPECLWTFPDVFNNKSTGKKDPLTVRSEITEVSPRDNCIYAARGVFSLYAGYYLYGARQTTRAGETVVDQIKSPDNPKIASVSFRHLVTRKLRLSTEGLLQETVSSEVVVLDIKKESDAIILRENLIELAVRVAARFACMHDALLIIKTPENEDALIFIKEYNLRIPDKEIALPDGRTLRLVDFLAEQKKARVPNLTPALPLILLIPHHEQTILAEFNGVGTKRIDPPIKEKVPGGAGTSESETLIDPFSHPLLKPHYFVVSTHGMSQTMCIRLKTVTPLDSLISSTQSYAFQVVRYIEVPSEAAGAASDEDLMKTACREGGRTIEEEVMTPEMLISPTFLFIQNLAEQISSADSAAGAAAAAAAPPITVDPYGGALQVKIVEILKAYARSVNKPLVVEAKDQFAFFFFHGFQILEDPSQRSKTLVIKKWLLNHGATPVIPIEKEILDKALDELADKLGKEVSDMTTQDVRDHWDFDPVGPSFMPMGLSKAELIDEFELTGDYSQPELDEMLKSHVAHGVLVYRGDAV